MPVTLNTIPASEAAPLKPKKSKSSSAKSILAAAATVSFIFGLLAATAVTPAPTRNGLAFDSQDLGRGQAVAAAAAGAANAQDLIMANKGMDVRFVYGLGACHTDVRLQLEQRVPALVWAMAPWKEKLAAKKSA